jgi:hypothetical protein
VPPTVGGSYVRALQRNNISAAHITVSRPGAPLAQGGGGGGPPDPLRPGESLGVPPASH